MEKTETVDKMPGAIIDCTQFTGNQRRKGEEEGEKGKV